MYMHVCMYVCVCVCVFAHVSIHTYIYIYMCVCVCTYILIIFYMHMGLVARCIINGISFLFAQLFLCCASQHFIFTYQQRYGTKASRAAMYEARGLVRADTARREIPAGMPAGARTPGKTRANY